MIRSTPTSGNIVGAGGLFLLALLGGTLLYFSGLSAGHAPPPTVRASNPVIDYEVTASDITVDWEAAIFLPRQELGLEAGEYDLSMLEDGLYAFKGQQRFPLAGRPVVVEVVSVEEED